MIIADTGFWLALANRKDLHHKKAVAALRRVREPLVTTWPVVTETSHLLLARLGARAQLAFVDSWIAGAFQVVPLGEDRAGRFRELMVQYADLPMDLADASLVILAETLGSGRILSTDRRDFHAYRWKNTKPFENLLA